MEENKKLEIEEIQALEQEEKSAFDFQTIYTTVILNWKWFLLSLIICLGTAAIYLRYATPMYQAFTKLLIKEDESNGRSNFQNMSVALGTISNSTGIDNEMEILQSFALAEQSVIDLKLYVTYMAEGKLKDHILYKNNPIAVDIDAAHLKLLESPIKMTIEREEDGFHVSGKYTYKNANEEYQVEEFNKILTKLPLTLATKVGYLYFRQEGFKPLAEGTKLLVTISPTKSMAAKYVKNLSVSQTSKMTTIAQLVITDEVPQRATDYLSQLIISYNRQANEDKNEVAIRTEEFINGRLEKINAELGSTEGELEAYKRRNNMVELKINATQAVGNQDAYAQRLNEANTQMALLNSIEEYMNMPENKYQTLPSNVGLKDPSATNIINRYNETVLRRNTLLRTGSEDNPSVAPLTAQLDEMEKSLRRAMSQARNSMEIERNAVMTQFNKYQSQISATPEQEKMLSQIGRQQEVKAGLYLMLLQKREENSISLAATADKGRLIDEPAYSGKVSPKTSIVLLIGFVLGIAIPASILFILNFFRYKIEGHDDVVRLTSLPILADVAVASDTAKTKADIVVHENKNNQMEEIFRSIRTNLQFMLKENEKVVMFTSSTSGEGKTFTAANLSVSFALLGKKVALVGLDIRRPRLAELFEIDDHKHGITNLLTKNDVTWEEVQDEILPSGVNKNLDLLMAGPTPPNPAELLARPSLDTIMQILRDHYDYIIIDTAPVGIVTDTLQIGRVSDATVVLCRADFTAKESFNMINALSNDKKLPNMSIVINGIDMSKKKYGYYYGYGKYGKYGRYGRYGRYGSYGKYGRYGTYGNYGSYGSYGSYGNYSNSHYGDKNDTSIKL